MYAPVQKCTQCGAGLSLDDMRRDGCPYCNTVYPHRSQAVQHQQVIQQVLGTMGVPPAQMPPPTPGMPPVYDPHAMARAQMAHAQRMSSTITRWVVGSMIASFVLVGIVVAVAML